MAAFAGVRRRRAGRDATASIPRGGAPGPTMTPSPVSRRRFLALAAGGVAATLAGCGTPGPGGARGATGATDRGPGPGTSESPPQARWVIEENRRPGTLRWALGGGPPPGELEGFCDTTSATYGDVVTFYVRSARRFRLEAYRMGYYQALGARLVATSPPHDPQGQPAPEVTEALGTVECRWNPTWRLRIDQRFPPGCYLVRLTTEQDWVQWIPFTVRDDTSDAAFVFMNSVTTWQAYNTWGGWSLYEGPTGRADVVSFDRPYALGLGQSNFLFNELPVLYDMERRGLDLHYWTDVDLHVRGGELTRHRCLVSLGHDEYWSWQMRAALVAALHRGVNAAFLGSNFCYRAIRFEPTWTGAQRRVVNYRSTADPIYRTDPKLTTVNWADPPLSMPESTFSGCRYDGFAAPGATWDLVVTDPASWLWRGTGVTEGTHLRAMEQNEYNHVDLSSSLAPHVQVLSHSPVPGSGGAYADTTYVALPGRGGVFSSGTSTWVLAMSNGTRIPHSVMRHRVPDVTGRLLGAMGNLYRVFGAGPAGARHPSRPNVGAYYG